MWFAGIWLALFGLLFVLPLLWLVPRWGAPYPSAYRRRRGTRYSETDISDTSAGRGVPVDSAHDQTTGSWGYWADLLWVGLLVLVIALAVGLAVT